MKKKAVALVLAGAMIFSQFMGSIELLATSTTNTKLAETPDVVEEESRQTTGQLESAAQERTPEGVYTVITTLEGIRIEKGFRAGERVSIEALDKEGHTFTMWTAQGLDDIRAEALKADPIVFTMPANDVTLTPNYSRISTKKKAILKREGTGDDNKVFVRNDEDGATTTEITSSEFDAITDLLIAEDVVNIPDNLFQRKSNITKLTFQNTGKTEPAMTIGSSAFQGTSVREVVLPDRLVTMKHSAFRGAAVLKKVEFGLGLTEIAGGVFQDATDLTEVDLRKAAKLTTIKPNVFKNTLIEKLIVGENTSAITTVENSNAFEGTPVSKKIHFIGDDGIYLYETKRKALETRWMAFEAESNGRWGFFDTKAEPPAAAVDYENMKLTGLNSSAKYRFTIVGDGTDRSDTIRDITIEADGKTVSGVNTMEGTITADDDGKVDIRQEWSGKMLRLTTLATEEKLESKPQIIPIQSIYTVTVDGEEFRRAIAEATINLTAEEKEGQSFVRWEVIGVELGNPTAKQITFQMPPSNVSITQVYKSSVAVPNVTVDYDKMKLIGLDPSAPYKITVQEAPASNKDSAVKAEPAAEMIFADADGEIEVKKTWGGKIVTIVSVKANTHLESEAKSLIIYPIYTVTVDGKEYKNTIEKKEIMVTAEKKEGHIFTGWKADGVQLQDMTLQTINFPMPAGNVILTTGYTKVVATPPEELVYDGDKKVSVKLDILRTAFTGIQVDGKMLEENKDYIITKAKGVEPAARGITVTFTKVYLDTLKNKEQVFKVVLTTGAVEFSIKVAEKPAKPTVAYPDVKEGEWFYEAVMYVNGEGIMSGYVDGTFGPADKLGRGQFATILYRMAGSLPVEYKNIFSDVPKSQFYSLPAIWAQTNNVLTGYADGKFGPSDSITREQLATMLYRYAMMKGKDVSARVDLNKYPDAGRISSFAKDAMSWVAATGIIKGDQGKLNPQGDSSRAVVATMIQRFETGQ